MSFPYKKILIVGATSGIGEALAARMIKEGKKVIVSGRRQGGPRLQSKQKCSMVIP